MTARLIYGIGAYDKALETAYSLSKRVYDFGGESLSTEQAKMATEKMIYAPIGSDMFCVVVGAVDNARGSATDALLKSIEEHPDFVLPILWANGLDRVPSTIRSRCSSEWTKDTDTAQDLSEYHKLLDACLASDYSVALMLGAQLISEGSSRGLLIGFSKVLVTKSFENPKVSILWQRVREALRQNYPLSKTEVLGVICI